MPPEKFDIERPDNQHVGWGPRTRAGPGAGEGWRRRGLSFRSASDGGAAGILTLPFTLGHENAGWVEKMGPGATGFAPGDPVIVYGPWGCGLCMNCRKGMENYCQVGAKPGGLRGNNGGMAEYLLVPAMTGAQGADLVLDLVAIDPTLTMAARMAKVLGHLTIVGVGDAALPVNFASPPHECSVAAPFWGSIPELIEVVTLAQSGRIQMLVEHFPLDHAGESYRLLHDGKIRGRAVITPND